MSRKLDDLDPLFRPLAIELLARCSEAGTPVMIIETARTEAEHLAQVAAGVSWTEHSKHVPVPPHGALALDIAPYDIYQLHGSDKLKWDSTDPVWLQIGLIGEGLGMRWGGRFKAPAKPDMGHFEISITALPSIQKV